MNPNFKNVLHLFCSINQNTSNPINDDRLQKHRGWKIGTLQGSISVEAIPVPEEDKVIRRHCHRDI
jgi:hypothetical protein